MKTVLTLFALMVVLPFSSHAQDEDVLRPRGGGRMGGGSSSSSSTPIMLGIEGGINYNMFSQKISGLQPNSIGAVYESGKGISPFFGAFIDVGLSNTIGLQLKLSYDQKNFSNTKEGIVECIATNPPQITDAKITVEFADKISYLDITPQLRWNITPEFIILVGPTVHFQMGNGSGTYTETFASDVDCFIYDALGNPSKTSTETVDSLGTASPRFGMQIDLGYKFALTPSISLVPKVGFQYMFTKLADDELDLVDKSRNNRFGPVPYTATDKLFHSMQFSLGLWFQL